MDDKGGNKYQEMSLVSKDTNGGFFCKQNLNNVKIVYSFLNKRDRIKLVTVCRLLKSLFESKQTLKVGLKSISLFLI